VHHTDSYVPRFQIIGTYHRATPCGIAQRKSANPMLKATHMTSSQSRDLDLIWTAEGIAAELNLPTRSTIHLLQTGKIPACKIARKWVVERGRLKELFLPQQV
jgi:hypothetical protein